MDGPEDLVGSRLEGGTRKRKMIRYVRDLKIVESKERIKRERTRG